MRQHINTSAATALVAGLACIFCITARTYAQLSPGELSKAHKELEGVENCTKCHEASQQLSPDKCYACHKLIAAEHQSGRGLHGRGDYTKCQLCHVEHQGRDYELVYWDKGEKNFDHTMTGYRLEGKHSTLDCRACHAVKFIKDKAPLDAEKIDLTRTYLGLDTACTSCHADKHRGQFATACTTCHTTVAWKPATGFDHSKTNYALTGKHIQVLCEKCHPVVVDNRSIDDSSYFKYKNIAHAQCFDCHAGNDVHKGKLGNICQSCHATEGWMVTNTAKFDHSKTRYPLEGKHVQVACNKCHIQGRPMTGLKFAACADCHSDFHKGAFAKRRSAGACEECHTVAGYSPSKFTIAQHDQSDYPLRGAHRAEPCLVCHVQTVAGSADSLYIFKHESTRCLACHLDAHKGEVRQYVDKSGCEGCHVEDSWQQVRFDHSTTKFALDGKHQAVPCRKCHPQKDSSNTTVAVTMTGAGTRCQDCHADIHHAQFASATSDAAPSTDCGRCHSAAGWHTLSFDHNRDSRYKLDGAHRQVPCHRCHPTQTVNGSSWVVYKPLETACASCHGGSQMPEAKG